jgi:predicted nuclease with TOPRIM domain
MTDESLRQMMSQFSADLREGREVMQSLARDQSIMAGSCMRIEEQIAHLSERLHELRVDHDRVVQEITLADKALLRRISKIERQAAWVRAWSAGAAAVVVTVGGALVWVAARLPLGEIVGGK